MSGEGRIVAVETTQGRIATGTVVCCAGAWSQEVGAMAGVDIPVRGEQRWLHFTPSDGGLPARLPLTVDFSTGFYFHREGPGLAFGGREQSLEELAVPAARRLPVLGGATGAVLLVGLLRGEPGLTTPSSARPTGRAASSTRPAFRATASSRRRPSASTSQSSSRA